jgi:alpha-tubulin suppressor-like RCC1 family protein
MIATYSSVTGFTPLVLAAAGDHTCANLIGPHPSTWCWGDNSSGQFTNDTTISSLTPEEIPGLTLPSLPQNIVSANSFMAPTYTCLSVTIRTFPPARQFGCLGDNSSGQLGDGTNISRLNYAADTQIPGTFADSGNLPSSLGPQHGCIFVDGADIWTPSLLCWGDNSSGQLGDGTTTSSDTAVTVL